MGHRISPQEIEEAVLATGLASEAAAFGVPDPRMGQAVHLVVQDRNLLVVVAQVDGPGYWNVSVRVGSRISLLHTGSGHIFLAFASAEERRLMLEAQEGAPSMPQGLERRLDEIREQGFEMMPSAQVPSVSNLSVPIFGPLGSVIAVLTCPFTQRLDKLDAPNIGGVLKHLHAAGQEISQRRSERD